LAVSDDVRERVLELLDEPGSRTRGSLIAEMDDVESTEVARALGQLLVDDEIEEHPDIDGAYRRQR
jgi:hypothetical protein